MTRELIGKHFHFYLFIIIFKRATSFIDGQTIEDVSKQMKNLKESNFIENENTRVII